MPTYQYRCADCDHRLEVVQSFTDEALTQCPECAGRLRKQFSAVGVVFKGSGFYRTDSRAGNGKQASDAGTKSGDSGKEKTSTANSSSTSSDAASSSSSKPSSTSGTGSSSAGTAAAAKS